jgi:hypothetical protein
MNIVSGNNMTLTYPYYYQVPINQEAPVSKFETAFKIAQLMVDRPGVAKNDLVGFLALVKEIEEALE